jgi:uncharacterized membrane protein YvbJ
MPCLQCGAILEADYIYCAECGAPVLVADIVGVKANHVVNDLTNNDHKPITFKEVAEFICILFSIGIVGCFVYLCWIMFGWTLSIPLVGPLIFIWLFFMAFKFVFVILNSLTNLTKIK